MLHQVLYVPEFKYNLISVARVTSQLKVWNLFTDELCAMQAPLSRNKIIIGQRVRNLYIRDYKFIKNPSPLVHSLNNCQSCNKNDFHNIWHNRLGHLPLYKMKFISLLSKHCNDKNFDTCTICY